MRACIEHEHHERFFRAEFVAQAVPAGALETEAAVIVVIAEYHHHAGIPRVTLGKAILHQTPAHGMTLVAGEYRHRGKRVGN